MSTIVIHSEEELKEKFLLLAYSVNNLRHAQKYFYKHYGAVAKARKEYWEVKVDGLLNLLGLPEHQNLKSIKMVNNGNDFIIHPQQINNDHSE